MGLVIYHISSTYLSKYIRKALVIDNLTDFNLSQNSEGCSGVLLTP